MDRDTGQVLDGWGHVRQSIRVILTTQIGSRVMRREFGSEIPDLVGRPQVSEVILAIYAATADAIARWEPRFRLTGVRLESGGPDGTVSLVIRGEYLGVIVEDDISLTDTIDLDDSVDLFAVLTHRGNPYRVGGEMLFVSAVPNDRALTWRGEPYVYRGEYFLA